MALHSSGSGSSGIPANICWPPYTTGTGDVLPTSEDFFRAGMSVDVLGSDADPHLLVMGTYSEPHSAFVLSNLNKLVEDETACIWTKFDLRNCGLTAPRVGHATVAVGAGEHTLMGGLLSETSSCSPTTASVFLHGGYRGNVRKHTTGRVDRSVFGDAYAVQLQTRVDNATINVEVEPVLKVATIRVSSVGLMDIERRWHCAFTAKSHVFIHGGWNEFGPIGSMMSLNSSSSTWQVTGTQGDVPSPRRWHSMTALDESCVQQLCFGGYDGDPDKPFSDAYLFDTQTTTWKAIVPRGDAPGGRSRHSLSAVSGAGNVKTLMLLGGYDEHHNISRPANGLYFLHTDDMRWERVDAPDVGELFPVCRVAHKAVPVGPHGLVIFGGYSSPHIQPLYFIDLRMLGKKLDFKQRQAGKVFER